MTSLDTAGLSRKLRSTYPGRDWRGRCQQLVWNVVWLTGTPQHDIATYPDARAAYRASKIVSRDPSGAPVGACHWWWEPEPYGHVAIELGDNDVWMASGHVDDGHGDGLGVIGVREYTRRTGFTYLGWSVDNGINKITLSSGLTPAIKSQEGFLMALTEEQQKRMLKQSDLDAYARDKIMLPVLSRVEQRTFESLKLTREQSALIREQNALLTRIADALEK
ncbi:hypothetical protein EG850_10920 [Gulosibacter macacae]|uniref:Uncharacterized protein n=1 Tax=Gulosibacter macacae TaxID=2488791 RepID=A0A3P3VYZ5_9MICO|nr:hypothetical protein [Gulosibacter macacae]RRJ85893.1 hypothetical protein EG850_10920 [Gulosibacter macacae]